VIVVLTIAALTGATAMYLASGEMAAASGSLRRTQARSLAWSGVQGAVAELSEQREKLLDGGAPALTREWELFVEESGARGVVRLMALGESSAVSETAKLDVNSATAEMLAKVPGIDAALASAILAERGRGPFASVEGLLRVSGITPAKLLGGEADGDASEGGGARSGGLARFLTVFSFDPNVQSGLGANGSDHRGNLRLNLHTEWSERLGAALDERFGQGAGAAAKGVMGSGTKFGSMGDVINAARSAGLKPESWAGLLDALSVTDDPFLAGRMDVNAAPVEVLAAVPGISAEAAAKIAAARSGLDDESRRSPAWVASRGILTGEQFAQAVDHLTSRSMQWRVRVEAGMASPDESGGMDRLSEAALADRVVLEAVIDVSSERPRVAYLRDMTMLEPARAMAAELAVEEPAAEPTEEPAPTGTAVNTGGTGAGDQRPAGHDLNLSSGTDHGFGDLHLGDLHVGDLNLGAGPAKGPIQEETGPVGPPAPTPSPTPVDRRLGRWTTGKTGNAGTGAPQ
jgi:DNA uptake protein ComE-like DNA-binding protein